MAIRFSLYIHSKENGEYLQKIVNSSRQGMLAESHSLDDLPAKVGGQADVIFLEYEENNPKLDRWIEKAAADPQNPPIFLFLQEISTNNLWKALRLGVKECFAFPIRNEEFQEALDRLPPTPTGLELGQTSRIIAFLGSKGGVGNSFVSTNLAYLLAHELKGQVLLVDLDLRYGQDIYFYDARPKYTIVDVIENFERIDSSYLQSLFHPYDKYLSLLPAPARLEEAESVTPDHLEKILNYLKTLRLFRIILLDCCHQMDEVTLKALEMSDEIVMVINPSIPALSNAKKLLELFPLLNLESVKTYLLLNSWQKRGDLNITEVESFLGRQVSGTVQFDPAQVGRSINEGRPLAEMTPRHPICRSLKTFTAKLLGQDLSKQNGRSWGWLKRIMGRG